MSIPKKLLQFGAGKIGRSFIGQVFSRGGYEVVFVDIAENVINEMNKRGKYDVVIKKDDNDEILHINNIRGVNTVNQNIVIKEIASAEIIAVSVGQNGLPHIAPLIARGLLMRYEQHPDQAVDIILAENLREAAQFMKNLLKEYLPKNYPLDKLVGLVETSIGKMVPIMSKKDVGNDILKVFAESYNTLIVDKKGFKNPIPDIEDIAPKENMKAWVDRKSFIHNLGHATTAYLAYLYSPEFNYIYQALEIDEIYQQVRATMLQSAKILLKQYPDEFTLTSLTAHIDDLLQRFTNRSLGDTIYRVGKDLNRKLSSEDRLAGAIKMGIKHKMPFENILYALVCGMFFRATNESGELLKADAIIVEKFKRGGLEHILKNISGFDSQFHSEIFSKATAMKKQIQLKYYI